ncbi:MAG: hypothetical protein KDE50_32445 [Caldilineaceae bacterium]|nr:hypothetical protein [Caldilineaceae bacterium]MCB0144637.1 hypothetical protein [Caldilineaceae bacterium]
MSLVEIHARLANTASLFLAVLAVWAIISRVRTRPLDSNWFGAAVIGELLLLAQFILGWVLYFEGYGVVLPRSYLHILYGAVAVIALPAGYMYFAQLENENVKSIALAFICIFLWGIVQRAGYVATTVPFTG